MIIKANLDREGTLRSSPNLRINCGHLSVESGSLSEASGPRDNFSHWTKEEVERPLGQ